MTGGLRYESAADMPVGMRQRLARQILAKLGLERGPAQKKTEKENR